MPRRNFSVVVPYNTDKLLALTTKVLQKHEQDGAASLIPLTLIAPLQQLTSVARAEYDHQNDLTRQSEKYNEERDLILGTHSTQNAYSAGTVRYYVTSARDILLGHFRGNERSLGDWGFTVNSPKGKVQIVMPRNSDNWIKLAKLVLKKHQEDGASSLLMNLGLDNMEMVLVKAEQKLQEAQALNREKEKATQRRNIALGTDKGQNSKTPNTVHYIIRAVRDLLLGNFRGKEQELGAWGFEVNVRTVKESVQ